MWGINGTVDRNVICDMDSVTVQKGGERLKAEP